MCANNLLIAVRKLIWTTSLANVRH